MVLSMSMSVSRFMFMSVPGSQDYFATFLFFRRNVLFFLGGGQTP